MVLEEKSESPKPVGDFLSPENKPLWVFTLDQRGVPNILPSLDQLVLLLWLKMLLHQQPVTMYLTVPVWKPSLFITHHNISYMLHKMTVMRHRCCQWSRQWFMRIWNLNLWLTWSQVFQYSLCKKRWTKGRSVLLSDYCDRQIIPSEASGLFTAATKTSS